MKSNPGVIAWIFDIYLDNWRTFRWCLYSKIDIRSVFHLCRPVIFSYNILYATISYFITEFSGFGNRPLGYKMLLKWLVIRRISLGVLENKRINGFFLLGSSLWFKKYLCGQSVLFPTSNNIWLGIKLGIKGAWLTSNKVGRRNWLTGTYVLLLTFCCFIAHFLPLYCSLFCIINVSNKSGW